MQHHFPESEEKVGLAVRLQLLQNPRRFSIELLRPLTFVMASSSITTVGGLVIVTQVISPDENAFPLQAADIKPQAPPPAPASPTKTGKRTATNLWVEPQVLGVVQIVIGLLCILLSLTAAYSEFLMYHAIFGCAAVFVVSGSLAVAARRQTSVTLVWACLVANTISVLLSLGGVAYLCMLLAGSRPSQEFCEGQYAVQNFTRCSRWLWGLNEVLHGLHGLFLVLLVLQVCIAVTVCAFSGKAIRRRHLYVPIAVVVENDQAPLTAAEVDGQISNFP
ncbi:membrane-spanning 4-domains subfamily A member 4A [Aulostomus maculatus]